tara:strand:+ start:235 stop:951 length:717 start_codon:yes stop_codon:yes gene_type:complete
MADFNPAGQISQILGNTISNTQRQTGALNQLRAGAALKDAAAKAAHPRALKEIQERGRMQMLSNLASQGFTPSESQRILGFTPDDRADSNLLYGSSILKNIGGMPGMAKGGRYATKNVPLRDFLTRGGPNFLSTYVGPTSAEQAARVQSETGDEEEYIAWDPKLKRVVKRKRKRKDKVSRAPNLHAATTELGRAGIHSEDGWDPGYYKGKKGGIKRAPSGDWVFKYEDGTMEIIRQKK